MGKKAQVKQQKSKESEMNKGKEANLDLSKQKRNELNRLIDKLLKVSSIIVGTGKIRDSHVEMEKLLEKIVEIENEVNVGFPSRNRATMKSLTDWMLENGSKIDGVEICEFEGYDYGLRSLKDINQNDLMISVPRKLMMTTEFARKSELEYLMQNDALLAHMPSMSLALFLLLEKFRGNSFWEPYLNSLPSSYNTVMYFTLDELDALKGSPTYEPALKQCQNIARQYGYLYSLFYNSNDAASAILRKVFTYEQYRIFVHTIQLFKH
ncbi:histone-lysine N-methyltransferase setd3-like isoform X2 [Cimex lectularius]|uniref:protein-histidine N-methyltransferase n=1 Tax=Cimex lectularius TaxID=79782 RepID=A0A8I6S4S8_CIMLE|nr:histone-lysine N-methyltransferase setd3-like isoform X2 [Cimex lectularius]